MISYPHADSDPVANVVEDMNDASVTQALRATLLWIIGLCFWFLSHTLQFHFHSVSSCWVFADKLASSVQTAAGSLQSLCNQCHLATASNHSNAHFPLATGGCQAVSDHSRGLCDSGLTWLYHGLVLSLYWPSCSKLYLVFHQCQWS